MDACKGTNQLVSYHTEDCALHKTQPRLMLIEPSDSCLMSCNVPFQGPPSMPRIDVFSQFQSVVIFVLSLSNAASDDKLE